LTIEIIDEDDRHEKEGKNESENGVILGTIKENRTRDKIGQSKLGLENHFSYFFKRKQFLSNGVK